MNSCASANCSTLIYIIIASNMNKKVCKNVNRKPLSDHTFLTIHIRISASGLPTFLLN
uniref:Uncharacterized protein n=1 Tax=Anguilla anguilla TaxID=7936 RepID=A0A0E9WFW5_ANGAN